MIRRCIQVYNVQTEAAVGTFGPSPLGAVSWSPDGKKVVYLGASNNDGPTTLMLVDMQAGTQKRIGGDAIHNTGPGHGMPIDNTFNGGSELGQWSADGEFFDISIVVGSGSSTYNKIGRVSMSDPTKFVPLTPDGINARYPALAPSGNSFVCIASSKRLQEGPVQIFIAHVFADGRTASFRQLTHFPLGWVPNLPSWRAATSVKVDPIP